MKLPSRVIVTLLLTLLSGAVASAGQFINSVQGVPGGGEATDPSPCGAGSFVTDWDSNGNIDCSQPTASQIITTPAGNLSGTTQALTNAELDTEKASSATLSAVGTINQPGNPVDWTQLKNVPAGFADGADANSGGGGGDVVGPAGAVSDNALPRFDGTTGELLQGSGVLVDDSNNLSTPGAITGSEFLSNSTGAWTLTLEEADANGSHYIRVKAPDARGTNLTLILPNTDPTSGQTMACSAPSAEVSTCSWITPSTGSTTETLTNKTLNAESTGNALTLPSKIPLGLVGCSGTTGTLLWNTLPTLAPTPTCTLGTTNTTLIRGVADFPDADGDYSVQREDIFLMSDWSGDIDVVLWWRSTATSGNAVWQVQTACRGDGQVDDVSWNTANTVTTAAKATANQLNSASITGLTTTGCAPSRKMHVRILRNRTHASDTIVGIVSLAEVEFTLRRTM